MKHWVPSGHGTQRPCGHRKIEPAGAAANEAVAQDVDTVDVQRRLARRVGADRDDDAGVERPAGRYGEPVRDHPQIRGASSRWALDTVTIAVAKAAPSSVPRIVRRIHVIVDLRPATVPREH